MKEVLMIIAAGIAFLIACYSIWLYLMPAGKRFREEVRAREVERQKAEEESAKKRRDVLSNLGRDFFVVVRHRDNVKKKTNLETEVINHLLERGLRQVLEIDEDLEGTLSKGTTSESDRLKEGALILRGLMYQYVASPNLVSGCDARLFEVKNGRLVIIWAMDVRVRDGLEHLAKKLTYEVAEFLVVREES